jgi:hypothetical protein
MDKDKDGKITVEEFEAVGYKGLPNFEDMGAEGHHYDVESGKFNLESWYVIYTTHVLVVRILSPPRRSV